MSEAARARVTVGNLIRAGRIIPQPCQECGTTEKVEAHHPLGYAGPNALVLEWFCPPHHRILHRSADQETNRPGGSVTLKAAAEQLGVTPDNLRGAIARGSLKAEKFGRDWFVDQREVDRYARDNRRKGNQ